MGGTLRSTLKRLLYAGAALALLLAGTADWPRH
jgi:hypothetical protein